MVFTIHRYLFRDLLRIFVLTTIAMTLILSLGSILRPIQKYGVAPSQVISLLGYFIPITLTFVLPMAAIFASAITYGRFAGDNEYDACKASGISTTSVIYPGLCLAIAVATANLILNFYVVPNYVSRAERSLKANAKQIVFRSIERQGYYEDDKGKFQILADQVLDKENTLLGVNVILINKGKSKSLITAESAFIEFDTHKDFNYITVLVNKGCKLDMDNMGSDQFYIDQLPLKGKIPSLLGDNIKFKKIEDVKKIKNNPLLFSPIRLKANEVYLELTTELLAQEISSKFADDQNPFFQMANNNRIILFTADKCELGKNNDITLLGNVELYEYDAHIKTDLIRKWTASSAQIKLESNEPDSLRIFSMEQAKWTDADGITGVPTTHNVRNLLLPAAIADRTQGSNLIDIVNSTTVEDPSPELTRQKELLNRKITVVFGQILAEIHSRLVFGLGCIVLILMAIALGILYKGSHMLTAFGISSIPAAFLIVFIVAGKNLTNNVVKTADILNVPYNGIYIMWTGLGILTILAFFIYRKLLRT